MKTKGPGRPKTIYTPPYPHKDLTLGECQASPCFLCKNMETRLLGGTWNILTSIRVRAWCIRKQEEFPEEKCPSYDEDGERE